MAALYADENVSFRIVDSLRALGLDVLCALDDGRANQGIPDPLVLARAIELERAVVTNNRDDYHRLHRRVPDHAGIITYTDDPDIELLAQRIHAPIAQQVTRAGQLLRIVKPSRP